MAHITRRNFLAGSAALAVTAGLAGCGGGSNGAATDAAKDSGKDLSRIASQEMIDAAKKEGTLVVYGSCEEAHVAACCQHFQDLFGIETQYQRLSTGEVESKVEEEKGNPSADVWFGGTTDPYNVAVTKGILEPYQANNASHLISDVYRDPDGNGFNYNGRLSSSCCHRTCQRIDRKQYISFTNNRTYSRYGRYARQRCRSSIYFRVERYGNDRIGCRYGRS